MCGCVLPSSPKVGETGPQEDSNISSTDKRQKVRLQAFVIEMHKELSLIT